MTELAPQHSARLRVRIFIDYWNFVLSLRNRSPGFMMDWSPLADILVREAANLLGQPLTYEAMHVYGSVDPQNENDLKLRNWFSTWLNRQPGVHAVVLERQRKRNHLRCPCCRSELANCPACGGDLRGTEEKGVDTRMATDLISLAWSDSYDVAVLVSSDRDFVPVIEFLQSRGLRVIHGAFPGQGSQISQKCWADFPIPKLMEEFRKR